MRSNKQSKIYDVIIAGAGPVGLFLACELALAKCSVLVLEKNENRNSPLKSAPFGIRGLNALSVEALDRRDLLQDLKIHQQIKSPHQNAGTGERLQVGHFAGIPFHAGDIDPSRWTYRLPSSTETSLISEMAELETALSRRAESLGVEILRGRPITDFHSHAEGVHVQAEPQSFEALWLVGCDGARSVVRKKGGFEFTGTEPEFTGYTLKVEMTGAEKLKPGRNLTPTGMYMQSQPGYLIMQDFDGGAFHASEKPVTAERAQEVLRRLSGTDVGITTLHTGTTWTDRARQATRYQNARVLLAGDAAHIHSPLGGQGLNLGLGDAMNLGWKLAATLHRQAPDELLETYFSERHPLGEQVLDWSRAQVAIMKPGPTARALNSIFRDLMATRDGATYFAGRVWGVFTHYDLGGDHPLVGHSAPNFKFADGLTLGQLMRDGQGVLLDFTHDTLLKNLANDFVTGLKYQAGTPQDSLGLRAVLVRPDGIVAWVTVDAPEENSLRAALARWFFHPKR